MRYSRVHLEGLGYELAPIVVTSDELEQRLAPAYTALRIQPGQLFALTGIRERRWWDDGQTLSAMAARAGRKALEAAGVAPDQLGVLLYAGVCRENLEPATACAVAAQLGVPRTADVHDISNACLAVMNGIMQIANAIELGQVRAGLVVSAESARQIVELTIDRLNRAPTMENFRLSLATLTGGSGAAAVVVVDESLALGGRRVLGGVARNDTRFHELCRWGPDTGIPASAPMFMRTDAISILNHGVALGVETWHDLRRVLDWGDDAPDRMIAHQVGAAHRTTVLDAIGFPASRDFSTFEHLGNIGTVSLPLTAAIAEERGFLQPGHRVALCGIGSGLNCLMLGVGW